MRKLCNDFTLIQLLVILLLLKVLSIVSVLDQRVEVEKLSRIRCRKELERLVSDKSLFPSFSYLHLTKAGGTTVEWVLENEKKSRGFSRGIFAAEVPYKQLHKNRYAFTFLRDPISRFASYVHFRRYDKRAKFRAHGTNLRWSLRNLSNLYTRRITGIPDGNGKDYEQKESRKYFRRSQSDKICLEAKSLLRNKFAVVGTSERMLDSLALVGFAFNFKNFPVFARINQQINNPGVDGLPDSVKEEFDLYNSCDIDLYNMANQMVDDAILCLGAKFQSYLKNFTLMQSKFVRSNPGCIKDCVNYGEIHNHGIVTG
jgi:hypothetical protein